jgi:ubiquinone/menaquinone biosynthesis C-methylase UbiE
MLRDSVRDSSPRLGGGTVGGRTTPRLTAGQIELVRRILSCPDCRSAIDQELVCPSCRRSFYPEEDGIISALPANMDGLNRGKEQLESLIESGGEGQDGRNVVLYERAFHDEQAQYYDHLFADPLPLRKYYEYLVGSIIAPLIRDKAFEVDLCCGTGKSSLPLAKRGIDVVGIDISREMLRIYARKAAQLPGKIVLIHADASRPPLRVNSCSAITMIGGLHHIPDREGCVEICCRALTDGGRLILHEPLKSGDTSGLSRFADNAYAICDLGRVWAAMGRRLGMPSRGGSTAVMEEPADFTPYERPFLSAGELSAMIPGAMKTETLRSQGNLSFRGFPPIFQGRVGLAPAWFVVRVDAWLSRTGRAGWSGDALFGVFRKTGEFLES